MSGGYLIFSLQRAGAEGIIAGRCFLQLEFLEEITDRIVDKKSVGRYSNNKEDIPKSFHDFWSALFYCS